MTEKANGGAGMTSEPHLSYVVAVLRCFLHTNNFRAWLFWNAHSRSFNLERPGHEKCQLCKIAYSVHLLYIQVWSNKYSCVTSDAVMDLMTPLYETTRRRWPQQFSSAKAQDAQDFINFILEAMHHCDNKALEKPQLVGGVTVPKAPPNDPIAHMAYIASHNKSMVWHQFSSGLVETINCLSCHQKRFVNTFAKLGGFALPIIAKDDNLEQLLDNYFNRPKNVTMDCDKCKTLQGQERYIKLFSLPNYLILVLRRFRGSYRPKLINNVAFAIKDLNMSKCSVKVPNQSGSETVKLYDLFAVINHTGELNNGNYSVFANTEHIGWREFNGPNVRLIKENDIQTKDAYILFYVHNGRFA